MSQHYPWNFLNKKAQMSICSHKSHLKKTSQNPTIYNSTQIPAKHQNKQKNPFAIPKKKKSSLKCPSLCWHFLCHIFRLKAIIAADCIVALSEAWKANWCEKCLLPNFKVPSSLITSGFTWAIAKSLTPRYRNGNGEERDTKSILLNRWKFILYEHEWKQWKKRVINKNQVSSCARELENFSKFFLVSWFLFHQQLALISSHIKVSSLEGFPVCPPRWAENVCHSS